MGILVDEGRRNGRPKMGIRAERTVKNNFKAPNSKLDLGGDHNQAGLKTVAFNGVNTT